MERRITVGAERDFWGDDDMFILVDRTMEQNDCDEAVVYLHGNLVPEYSYVVKLRTTGGLYFDENCSGSNTGRLRDWRVTGRSWYIKDFLVYTCTGQSSGSMFVEIYRDVPNAQVLGDVDATVNISPPTPTPTIPPTPSPGTVTCFDLLRDATRIPIEGFEVRYLDAAMTPGTCSDVTVVVPDLNWSVDYSVDVTTSGGLAFDQNCTSRTRPPEVLSGQGAHRFIVPVFACADTTNYGTVQARVRQGSATLDPVSSDAVVIPETTLVGKRNSASLTDVCLVDRMVSRDESEGRTIDFGREAHYLRTTIYEGTSQVEESIKGGKFFAGFKLPAGIVFDIGMFLAESRCLVGHVETVSSFQGTMMLDFRFVKQSSGGNVEETIDGSKRCDGGGQICEVINGNFWFTKIAPGSDTYSLSGVHRAYMNNVEISHLSAGTTHDP